MLFISRSFDDFGSIWRRRRQRSRDDDNRSEARVYRAAAVMRSHATRPRRVRMARRRPGRSRGDRLGRRRRSRARLPAGSRRNRRRRRLAVRANASLFKAALPRGAYDGGLCFVFFGSCLFIIHPNRSSLHWKRLRLLRGRGWKSFRV
jgi:hypothetical protein